MNATRTRSTSSKSSSSRRGGGSGSSGGSGGGRGAKKSAKSGRTGTAAKSNGGRKTAGSGGAAKGATTRGGKGASGGARKGAAGGGRKTASKQPAGSSARKPSGARGSSARKSASSSRGERGASSGRASRTPVGQAIEKLSSDHRMVEKLFRQGERAKNDKRQLREIVDACCAALTLHAEIEEQYFYPVLREAGTGDTGDMIAEAEVEHASAKQLIAQLQGGDPQDEQYAATFKVLGEYVKHHVNEEENEIFPKARRARGDFEPLLEALMARDSALGGGQAQGRPAASGERETTSGATARNATRGRGSRSRSSGEGRDESGGEQSAAEGASSEGGDARRGRRGGQPSDNEDVETMSRGREDDDESARGSRQGGR